MFKLNSAILFGCFVFCFVNLSESLIQSETESHTVKPNDSQLKISELQRRQQIAENYMSTLEKAKETWVDPYEMINSALKERHKFTKPTHENTLKSSYNLNSDEEPLFSDIRGDVIGSKVSKVDDIEDDGIVSGGHFAKDRQQICVLDSIYISRWLKKLILKVEKDSNSEPSSVTFPLDASMLDTLRELSTAKTLEISQLDELICSMLAQVTVSKKEEFDWIIVLDFIRYISYSALIACGCLFLAYCLYTWSRYCPILTCVIIFCLINVFWHWRHLYEQRIAYKHAELASGKLPEECRKHDFGFFENMKHYLQSFFKNDECVKYHEALLVDPMWEVSISVAVSEALTATLLQPLSVLSRTLNSAWKHLVDGLTWEARIIVYIFLFLLLVMGFKYKIKLPFFMGALEPHYPEGSCVQNVKPRKTLMMSSKEKAGKVMQYLQGKETLKIQQDRNLDESMCDKSQKMTPRLYSSRPVAVNWRPNQCSKDCGHSSYLEVCENSEHLDGNDSEGIEVEKPEMEQCEHCSCCLSSADVQYLHEDCRVCSSEESRSAAMSSVREDADFSTVSDCTNCSGDKILTDHCVDKSNGTPLHRISKTITGSNACSCATKYVKDTCA